MAIQGTVTLTGPIAPTTTGDTYPVFDAIYGLDGLRNVETITDRNAIPNDRRRAGMLVGVSGLSGTEYYTLLDSPWNGTSSDWKKFSSGNSVTGFTFNQSNYDLSIGIADATGYTQSLAILASDITITGGTYNSSNGVVTLTNSSGGTFDISGFTSGYTDTKVTGGTYSNGTLTINQTDGSAPQITGLTQYTANNGISQAGTTNINFQLGGPLIQNTTITSSGNLLSITGSGSTGTLGSNHNLYVYNDTSATNSTAIYANSLNGTGINGFGGLGGIYGYSSAGYGVKAQGTAGTALFANSISGAAAEFQIFNSPNNTVKPILSLSRYCTNTSSGDTGLGSSIDFNITDNGNNAQTALRLITKWENAIRSDRTSKFEIHTTLSATTAKKLSIEGSGQLVLDKYGVATFAGSPSYLLGVNATGGTLEFTGSTNRIPFFDYTGKITTSSEFTYQQGGTPNNISATLVLPSSTSAISFGGGRVVVSSQGVPNGLNLELAAGQGALNTPSQNPDVSKKFEFKNKSFNTLLSMGHYDSPTSYPNTKFKTSTGYVLFSAPYTQFGGQVIVNANSAGGGGNNGVPNPIRAFWGTAGAGFDVRGITYTEANSTVTPANRSDIVANSFQTPTFSASTTIVTGLQTYATTSNSLMFYSASTAGAIQSYTINDPILDTFKNGGLFTLPSLGTSPVGTTSYLNETLSATSTGYFGVSYSQIVVQTGATIAGFFTGITTGTTTYYTGVTTAVTYDSLSNVYIAGAPSKGTNVSGNTYAFKVNSGDVYLGGRTFMSPKVDQYGYVTIPSYRPDLGLSLSVSGSTHNETSTTDVFDLRSSVTIGRPKIYSNNAIKLYNLSTVYIENAPDAIGSASINANAFALKIASGDTYFGGGLFVPAAAGTGFAGKVTLPGGATNRILVNNPNAAANSLIFLSHQTSSGVLGHLYVETLLPGSFYIRSNSSTDLSDVVYMIVNTDT
jgi:hypothetical protein